MVSSTKKPLFDVFISHSSEDETVARAILHHLEAKKARAFLAQDRIRPGSSWRADLAEAIDASRAVVLIVSKHSNGSKYVREEITLACDAGLTIFPFRLEEVTLHPELRLPLAGKHWLDAIDPPMEAHIQKLVWQVCEVLGIETGGPPPPPPPPPPSRLPLIAAVLAGLLLVGLGAWKFLRPEDHSVDAGSKFVDVPATPAPDPVRTPVVKFLQVDGVSPVVGVVKAYRVPDRIDGPTQQPLDNGIVFDVCLQTTNGLSLAAGMMEVQFMAASVEDPQAHPTPGQILIDPATLAAGGKWNAIFKMEAGDHSTFSHYAVYLSEAPGPVVSGRLPVGIYAGKKGVIPDGKYPVRLLYYSLPERKGEVLAKADFTLDLHSAPWSMEGDSQIHLLAADGVTPLEAAPVPVVRNFPHLSYIGNADPVPYENQGFTLRFISTAGDAIVPGPIALHVYALDARLSDDPPRDAHELVFDRTINPNARWVTLPQGRCLELVNFETWLPAGQNVAPGKFPGGPSFQIGAAGRTPAGEHEFGVVLDRGATVLYRGKIKVVATDDWTLPEAETKLLVKDANGRRIEEGQAVPAMRAGPYEWQGKQSTVGLTFALKLEAKDEPVLGPFELHYNLKATNDPAPPRGMMSVGWKTMPKATADGFTVLSSWSRPLGGADPSALAPHTAADASNLVFYLGNSAIGQGSVAPGLYDVGLEVLDRLGGCVYRGVVKLEVP